MVIHDCSHKPVTNISVTPFAKDSSGILLRYTHFISTKEIVWNKFIVQCTFNSDVYILLLIYTECT